MSRPLILFVVALLSCASALAEPLSRSDIAIVDGDTIHAHGKTYRLVGFDAPETSNAKCPAERELGERAAKRLKEIVDLGGLDLTEVPCSCLPGTRHTRFCNYGRQCGVLRVGGNDVGAILIREDLGRPFYCGKYRCPRRRGWC
jgi:endonuclease YncB( thermonuclease family)